MKSWLAKLWLILGAIPFAVGIGSFIVERFQTRRDITNLEAVLTEIGLAILLALAFYLIQNENSVKRKKFWVKTAHKELQAINDQFTEAKKTCERVLSEEQTKESAIIYLESNYSNSKHHLPMLGTAMSQTADLLHDPSLFHDITRYDYRQFTDPLNEAADHLTDNEQIKNILNVLEEYIKNIEGYLKRLEAEM